MFMFYLPAHITRVFPPIVTIMVYPPRNTTCHVYLYVSFLVDHDLQSTLHALF